jgi:UDPglucose--hexose-1-phosphate uridylyltransferase
MPLNKFIAHAGICARRDAADLVKSGKVTVNGQKIVEPGFKVTNNDDIKVQGKKISARKNLVYILLNKPKDFITTTEDPQGRKTVLDIVKSATTERVYPIGRLDRNTTGVLLLTNDGELAQKLSHPSYEVRKIYEVTLDRQGEGLFDKMNGIGAHEVIVESPRHDDTLATQPEAGVERLLRAFQERIHDLRRDGRFKSFVPFKNHGAAAGAALAHSHTQLLALPVVPREIQAEVDGARAHYLAKERCLFCDIIRQEEEDGRRVILRMPDMLALAPFASRSPFETWILPRRHAVRFEDASLEECRRLAQMLGDVLRRLDRALEQPPYSLVIHTAPVADDHDFYHWHVEILPRVTRTGSLEWATGFHMNPTRPEDAAHFLRQLTLR